MKKLLIAFATLLACVVVGITAAPAAASTQPYCSGTSAQPGYDYAGFYDSTTLSVLNYMSANIADNGSSYGDPSEAGHGGHIAAWVGVSNNYGGWIQAGILYGDWAVAGGWMNPPQTPLAGPPFADGLYAYIEANWNGNYQFGAWPISGQTYYSARVTRNSTYTYTATIAGHSLTETFDHVNTAEQITGENYQSPIGSLCNVANQSFQNLHPSSIATVGKEYITNRAAFDIVGLSPFAWWSPWTGGGGCNPNCSPIR